MTIDDAVILVLIVMAIVIGIGTIYLTWTDKDYMPSKEAPKIPEDIYEF